MPYGQRKSKKLRRKRTRNYSKNLAPQAQRNNCAASARANVTFERYNSNELTAQTALGYGTKPIFKLCTLPNQ